MMVLGQSGEVFINYQFKNNTYDLDRDAAFYITVRAHRGGGVTKYYLYLTDLKTVYEYYHQHKDLNLLLTGKVSLEYIQHIENMSQKGYALSTKHATKAFAKNNNSYKTIDFILSRLK